MNEEFDFELLDGLGGTTPSGKPNGAGTRAGKNLINYIQHILFTPESHYAFDSFWRDQRNYGFDVSPIVNDLARKPRNWHAFVCYHDPTSLSLRGFGRRSKELLGQYLSEKDLIQVVIPKDI